MHLIGLVPVLTLLPRVCLFVCFLQWMKISRVLQLVAQQRFRHCRMLSPKIVCASYILPPLKAWDHHGYG